MQHLPLRLTGIDLDQIRYSPMAEVVMARVLRVPECAGV